MALNYKHNTAYHKYLVQYMSYLHVQEFERNTIFSDEQLIASDPISISQWMCVKAFGEPQPPPNACSTLCRSSTLEVYKKALSWYMPHRVSPWNQMSLFGNPTKSKEVNDVIKAVKKQEVRRLGKTSSTKRAMTQKEFIVALEFFKDDPDFESNIRIPCMMLFQYHLITRCDDLGHFRTLDLSGHPDSHFSYFALSTKVHWSKNVLEERNCPQQIILGSMNDQYCLLLSLGIYLETWLGHNTNHTFLFSDDFDEVRAAARLKTNYGRKLKKNCLIIQHSLIKQVHLLQTVVHLVVIRYANKQQRGLE